MMPVRRDYRFKLSPRRLRNWHRNGVPVSHFFNALSMFFPVGERFFIGSVRNYRGSIRSAELRKAVSVFIGQEATHGREHQAYNRLLADAGLPADALERFVGKLLGVVQKSAPASWQLSATIALEHFTAILADRLLDDRRLLDGADPAFKKLWLWHALEETEHKAVAYDVWREAMGEGAEAYAVRSVGMLLTSAIFVTLVLGFSAVLIEHDMADHAERRQRLAAYRALAAFLLGRGGLVRSGFPAWLDYFRPGFHPWQHDNRELLRRLDEIAPAPPLLAQAA
jgi:predicted metal-dependent hydrolase